MTLSLTQVTDLIPRALALWADEAVPARPSLSLIERLSAVRTASFPSKNALSERETFSFSHEIYPRPTGSDRPVQYRPHCSTICHRYGAQEGDDKTESELTKRESAGYLHESPQPQPRPLQPEQHRHPPAMATSSR